ncbi:MAG TPA: hypothetical protein VM802_21945 [Chitinophaga sp.]|uniref:hypothetical protein n=1 Tax=Chitinophaga sp. TaxID=1869181 RepID=UPI002C600D2A|nr:hypothetical protein [Chitinophaga sp.]HVI47548.1 hypothetical protein [Chitinophaga sp.]
MFDKTDVNNLFDSFENRENIIKNTDKIPVKDPTYLSFISNYQEIVITADIQLLGYEEALNENRYVEKNYPDLYSKAWMFGQSGQGDEWFLDRETSSVLYYAHNKGDYAGMDAFLDFHIDFARFVQAALLVQQLEKQLDEIEDGGDGSMEDLEAAFKEILKTVDLEFYELYPYKYF